MGCATYEEIASIVDCSETAAKDVISSEMANLPNPTKSQSEHLVDFTPPIYNIWKQQEK